MTMVSASGLRSSNLADHLRDSFDNGLVRIEHALSFEPILGLVFWIIAGFVGGTLIALVSPLYYFRWGRGAMVGKFFYGTYYLMLSIGAVAWFFLPYEKIDRRVRQHKLRMRLFAKKWVG